MEEDIKELIDKTLTKIDREGDYRLTFYANDGTQYLMHHYQNCCESVAIEDINGELDDLIDTPITMAEEVTNDGNTEYGSQTWTFYKIATIKGYVTIRWYGSSNGYYSESVNFEKLK